MTSRSSAVTRRVTDYKTLRDTIRLTDTVAVVKLIHATDSLAASCSVFRSTCERALAADSAVITSLNLRLQLTERRVPSKLDRVAGAAKWLVVGAAVGAVLSHH